MSLEQTLIKLQNSIHETLPTLELFMDVKTQPGSSDCEKLQKQLQALQEQVSVFKYLKTTKEISPSFGLHSKISEVVVPKQETNTETTVTVDIPPVKEEIKAEPETLSEPVSTNVSGNSSSKKLEITLNQKFQFINDLFNQNATEYGLAIDQLNASENWDDADTYIQSLKSIYNWKDANENFKRLKELTKKRFE